MKSRAVVAIIALILAVSDGFSPCCWVREGRCHLDSTALEMGGFLDGRVPKNDIMKREDDAMWVEDEESGKSEGWNPFKIAASFDPPKKKAGQKKIAPEPKEAPKKKSAGGFKMPWDNN